MALSISLVATAEPEIPRSTELMRVNTLPVAPSFLKIQFMSQIVDYDDKALEKLSLYARNLRPMLREMFMEEDGIDLDNVVLSHYRLSVIRQQDLKLKEDSADYKLEPGEGLGTAKAKDKHEEFLSQIISRLNELFITDHLTENGLCIGFCVYGAATTPPTTSRCPELSAPFAKSRVPTSSLNSALPGRVRRPLPANLTAGTNARSKERRVKSPSSPRGVPKLSCGLANRPTGVWFRHSLPAFRQASRLGMGRSPERANAEPAAQYRFP